MKYNNEKKYLIFLFCLTIFISFIPFFKIGFTTSDDFEYYLTYLKGDFWSDAWYYAQIAGRFYFLITKPFYSLPYLFDNFYFTKILQHGTLIISYLLFSWLIFKMFKSKNLAGFVLLLLVMNTLVTFNLHIPFIAYPVFFTFSFCLCIISVLLFLKYTETQNYKYVIFSAILFFITMLFYETYLVILSYMCLYIIIRSLKIRTWNGTYKNKLFYKEIIPFVSAGVLYVALYFIFRIFVTNSNNPDEFYLGTSFAKNFSLSHFFDILIKCTKINFPTQSFLYYHNYMHVNTLQIAGHNDNIWYLLTHAQPVIYVNAFIQCFIFVYFAKRIKNTISWRTILWGILFSLMASYSIHVLIGISDKYNSDWYSWMRGYVTSYYSYFGIMLFIAFCLYALIKIVYNNMKYRNISIALCTCMIFFVSFITGYTNDNLSKEWIRSKNRFDVIDYLIEHNVFDKIPENAIVYNEDLYNSYNMENVLGDDSKIDTYINIKTNRNIIFANNPESLSYLIEKHPQSSIYLINKKETIKNTELLLTMSPVDKNTILFNTENPFESATCKDASVYYYSPTKDFTLLLDFVNYDSINNIIVNHDTINLGRYNRIAIKSMNKNNPVTSVDIKSDNEMYVTRFSVSNMIPDMSPDIIIEDDKE